MKITINPPLLLTITLCVLVGSQTASAMNLSKSLQIENDVKKKKEPINRLKNYYPPSGSKEFDLLNEEEVKYVKKLLLEGQKENLDAIDKLMFWYDEKGRATSGWAALGRTNATKYAIAFGHSFNKLSEKGKVVALKHELGHFLHGDLERPSTTHSNYPQLFKLTTALGAGLFGLATNHGKISSHTWLRTGLALPVGWGMAESLFMICNARQSYKDEYAADTYAALNCPDSSYIKAFTGWLKKLIADPLFGASPDDLKKLDSMPQLKRLVPTLQKWLPLFELLFSNKPHPSHKNRIKKLEKIMKQMELEDAKKPRIEPTVKLSGKTPDWFKIVGTTEQLHEPLIKQETKQEVLVKE